ncbi:MAG: ABC transporter permease subunit [Alphaproteobacteria bacterium]|nr:ABC transporter permease subunit [Alphaproteobacteria bacterium]
MRWGPIVAIAQRDLRMELSGRQGLGLPIIALALLLPASLLRMPAPEVEDLPVRGAVPDAVLAVPGVRKTRTGTGFRDVDGVTTVYAWSVPPAIREALDGDAPAVKVEAVTRPPRVPKRSLLFALVSASTLTGAVSTSIGGERARNTLLALLSAAVTRMEIVLGKWLAWTAFGAGGAMIAAIAALIGGTQPAGPWLLAVPMVPALTVALGLWLVRRTEDVIAGTSVSLRVLPAVLGATGFVAWLLQEVHPVLGAAVPLGGALLAAGDLWDGAWLPTIVGILSAAAATAFFLVGTARDLEQHVPYGETRRVQPLRAVIDGATTMGVWWAVVPGPVLWGWAGNPAMTDILGVERGLIAGAALLATLAGVGMLRATHAADRPRLGGLHWPTVVGAGVVGGLALALAPGATSLNPWVTAAAARFHAGLVPPALVAVPVLLAQEAWFRGWMQQRAGWIPTALAFAVVMAPFDPVAGLVLGLALGWAGRTSLGSAVAARALAWVVAMVLA